MKKLLTLILSGLLLAPWMSAIADDNTVLLFVRDDSRDWKLMLEDEVLVMKEMLEAEGYKVEIASNDGADLSAEGVTVAVDHRIDDVSMDDFGAIAIPCMAPSAGYELESKVISLIQEANAANKPIAASRGSVDYLAEAGVLDGRRFAAASPVDVQEQPSFRNSIFTGTGTQRDGIVSTTGICPLAARNRNLPDGTADLTLSLIESLKAGS